jgi:hypothetical protein
MWGSDSKIGKKTAEFPARARGHIFHPYEPVKSYIAEGKPKIRLL